MTLRLHQTFGAHTGRRLAFDEPLIRLGRSPDSDVAFDPHADRDASARHAEIRREGTCWVLIDVGSRNGTFVNGQPVRRHVLADGDELEFGPGGPRLRVELAAPPHARTQEATPIAAPSARTQEATPIAPPSPAPAQQAARPYGAPIPPGAVQTPKRYGERTVALMVQGALASARRRRLRLAFLGLGLALTLLAAVWILRSRRVPEGAPDAVQIAASNAGALYRLVEQSTGGSERVLCTAFAVRRRLLATTAQCVLAAEARRAAGSQIEVRGAAGASPILRLWQHPGFVPGVESPDVGLLEVDGAAGALVTLASLTRLHELGEGDPLLAYGFVDGRARAVPFEIALVTGDAQARRFRHAAEAPPGAPVFDRDGAVIGVHSARVPDPPHAVASGAGYVVGSDALLAMLAGLGR